MGCTKNNIGNDFIIVYMQNGETTTGMELNLYPTYVKSTQISATISSPGSSSVINQVVQVQGGKSAQYIYYFHLIYEV